MAESRGIWRRLPVLRYTRPTPKRGYRDSASAARQDTLSRRAHSGRAANCPTHRGRWQFSASTASGPVRRRGSLPVDCRRSPPLQHWPANPHPDCDRIPRALTSRADRSGSASPFDLRFAERQARRLPADQGPLRKPQSHPERIQCSYLRPRSGRGACAHPPAHDDRTARRNHC